MNRLAVVLLVAGLTAVAIAGRPLMDERVLTDSVRTMPPRLKLLWLHRRGIEMPGYSGGRITGSGLTLDGKWGRGPAAEVTRRETPVVLTPGSEAALRSFAEPDSPRALPEATIRIRMSVSGTGRRIEVAGHRPAQPDWRGPRFSWPRNREEPGCV